MTAPQNSSRLAWPLTEIAKQTGLSVSFLRKEIRNGRLKCRKFGARVLVLNDDLELYLRGEKPGDEVALI